MKVVRIVLTKGCKRLLCDESRWSTFVLPQTRSGATLSTDPSPVLPVQMQEPDMMGNRRAGWRHTPEQRR